jgi:hypothetical protein
MCGPPDPEMRNRPAANGTAYRKGCIPEMRALFRAIAAGEPRRELWLMLNKLTQKLSAAEREALNDLFAAALK